MAIRFPTFVPFVSRATETALEPTAAQPASPAAANELFADGFSGAARGPLSLDAQSFGDLPRTASALPSFKVGAFGNVMPVALTETAGAEAAGAEAAGAKGPLERGTEYVEAAHDGVEQLNNLREAGAGFSEAKAGALDALDSQISQYSRVEPNLTGARQAYAQSVIDAAESNRADLAAYQGTNAERAGQLLEDVPGSGALGAIESTPLKGLGIGASALSSYFEGANLYKNGDDLLSAESGALANFGVGTLPGTQGIAAFDTLSKVGVGLAADGLEKLGVGDSAASESIYGRGVFTDTAVDGARAFANLGEAAVTGDTSGLDNFRNTVDNGSLFERSLGTVGNFFGATAAAISTGSTQPFKDFASDTSAMFSTLGQTPAPAAAPVQPSIFDTRSATTPGDPLPNSVLFGDPLPSPTQAAPEPAPAPVEELPEIVVSADRLPPTEDLSNPFDSGSDQGFSDYGGGADFGGDFGD